MLFDVLMVEMVERQEHRHDNRQGKPRKASSFGWLVGGNRGVLLVIALLITLDLVIVAVDLYARALGLPNVTYYVDTDRGFGELVQYVKYVWLIMLVGFYAVENRTWRPAMWLPVFAFFLIDDAFEGHEYAGSQLSQSLGLVDAFGMRSQDVGEVVFFAIVGAVFLILLLIGYVGAELRTRRIYHVFALLMVAVAFFGIVLDAVHRMVVDVSVLGSAVAFAEDAGELLTVTVMVVFAVRINLSGGRPGFAAVDRV